MAMEEHHIPGASELRIGHLRVGVGILEVIWRAERELEIYSLMAVPLDACVHLESSLVKHEALRQLGIVVFGIEESRLADATFLLRFNTR
jgi:hypothetical protein